MLTHHIITTVLVTASYYMNFTRVGIVVLVLMDFVDIVLPVSPVPGEILTAKRIH
jgi:acyl-CoA-dependent ceramide synthase